MNLLGTLNSFTEYAVFDFMRINYVTGFENKY